MALLIATAPGALRAESGVPTAIEPGMPAEVLIVFGLLWLCGLVAIGVLVERLVRVARRRDSRPTYVQLRDAVIEQELQAMIAEASVARKRAPA